MLLLTHFHVHQCLTHFLCNTRTTTIHFYSNCQGLKALPSCTAQTERRIPVNDSYLFDPKFDPCGRQPYHFDRISYYQKNYFALHMLPTTNPKRYFSQLLDKHSIVCHCDTFDLSSSWKILLPITMLKPLVKWHHGITVLSIGMDRLEAIIWLHFYHPKLRHACWKIVSNCKICLQVQTSSRQTGQLAPCNAPIL